MLPLRVNLWRRHPKGLCRGVGRLLQPTTVDDWIEKALEYPGISLLELTPRIAIESSRLNAPFHKDPANQNIVATAREYGCELATLDEKIRSYSHVKLCDEEI